MAVYVLTYDLSAPGQDYAGLIGALDSAKGVRFQLSAWLLDVNQTVAEVREAVRSWMDANDRVFVAEITTQADWAAFDMIPPSGQWLKARRP